MNKNKLHTLNISLSSIIIIHLIGIGHCTVKSTEVPILESKVLNLLDGLAIRVPEIYNMMHVRKKVRELHLGNLDQSSGHRTGHYLFHDKYYSIHELATVESEMINKCTKEMQKLFDAYVNEKSFELAWHTLLEKIKNYYNELLEQEYAIITQQYHTYEKQLLKKKHIERRLEQDKQNELAQQYEDLKIEHVNNKEKYLKHTLIIEDKYKKDLINLQKLLEKAKNDILVITRPHMSQAQELKDFVEQLLEEWAKKTNRIDSPLLRGLEGNVEEDVEAFKKAVTSFTHLDLFCKDMTNYISSIILSCPKAFAQYKKLCTAKTSP